MYMNRTVQKTFPVTACALSNSRQHLHENMFIFKKTKKQRGKDECDCSVRIPALQHGKDFFFFLSALLDTKITRF